MKDTLIEHIWKTPNGPVVTFLWPVTGATGPWLEDLYEQLKDLYENDNGR